MSIAIENKTSIINLSEVLAERGNIEKKMLENFPKPLKCPLIILFKLILFPNLKYQFIG